MTTKYLNRETISYLIVGGLTTLLSWILFTLALYFDLGTVAANNIANIIAVLFAFLANKIFVFQSSSWAVGKVLPEALRFFASRLLTHGLETAALVVLVDMFGFPGAIMKVLTMAVIQVLGNYALSKWVVFVRK
jgi:putative flippase GtrA